LEGNDQECQKICSSVHYMSEKCKYDNAASLGLLQSLPVPDLVWQHITMDFIEGLPSSYGK